MCGQARRRSRAKEISIVSEVEFVWLDAGQTVDEKAVGAKAMSLVRLKRIGLAVPAGFCISEAVFRQHLERNNLTAQLKTAIEALGEAEPPAKVSVLSDLRRAIIEAPLAGPVRQKIEEHYRVLGADRVAVRSSATAEDLPGHSFAGQYDTYLGVTKIEDCIKAVKKCWASLWTERAYDYRQKNGFDHLAVSMAVIVQSLIAADVSGVLFTADPITGESDRLIIEACFGLGDVLVLGKVTPDRFVVSKDDPAIISKEVSQKHISSVLDDQGSVKEQALGAERASESSIDATIATRLAGLAKKAETEFGCPQDMEWALSGTDIFFLQARPITTIGPKKSWEDRQIWCSNPAKEVMPDVVTPMTLSMLSETMAEEFFDPIFRVLCIDRGNHPIWTLVAGRIYFNANIWGVVFRCVPGGRSVDLMELAGGHEGIRQAVQKLRTATDEDLPDVEFSRLRFILKMPLIIIQTLFNTPRKGQRILACVSAKNENWNRLDLASLSAEQIVTRCQDLITDLRELLGHILYLFSILAALPILYILCAKWFKDEDCCAARLLAGLGGMADAAAGLELWRLAVAADARPDVKELILSNEDWRTIEGKLSQLDSGKQFLDSWGQFMACHGHHCRAELELYNRRWFETPDYILKLVRTYITQIGKIDPVENYSKRAHERLRLERQCRQRLKNPIKRMIFNRLLARSQKGSVFRENVKSEVIKLIVALRKMLLELGKRLADKEVLKSQDDIFFLQLEEIVSIVQGKADSDIHQVVSARRAEYERNKLIAPPDVVFGKFDADTYSPDVVDTEADVLNGFGVSPGVATGKARVILRADNDERLLAGEILVAPFTDPGWTPYFVPAAGIVMDQGGLLSHGSIVAREYGIPAVVNVGLATQIIKTGQTIQVDGNRGIVRIL